MNSKVILTTEKPALPAAAETGLFRSDALARISSPDRLDLGARLVSPASWLLLSVAVLFIVTAVIGSIAIQVPIKVAAEGLLMTPLGVKDVVSETSGRVRSIRVRVGDRIAVNQPIASIEQPDLQQEITVATAELRDSSDQFNHVRAFQSRTMSEQDGMRVDLRKELQAKLDFTVQRRVWLKQQVETVGKLVELGIEAKPQLMAANVDLGSADEEIAHSRNALKQLEIDAKKQKTDYDREALDLELKQASAQRKLAMLQERLGRLDVLQSPYSGVVVELKLNEGEMIDRGRTLLSLLPDLSAVDGSGNTAHPHIPLIATLYVGSADGKRIHKGMEAEVVPATVKREEYGFIAGRVLSVAEMPATQEGMQRTLKNEKLVQTLSQSGAPFEVIVALDTDPANPTGFRWSSSHGPSESLSAGSLCAAEVVTRKETVFKLLVPALRRFLSKSDT
ncbi:MAG TPA: NHLP bacteriocin system secretion protein [Herbaspirillum sp.]|nr:NHLP bacteriocin system secretion protein [Herbaspirillum sp.]